MEKLYPPTPEPQTNRIWEQLENFVREQVVSEATLTSAIQEIRKALQDNAREPQYVETVPKRGFRFIGEVVGSQHSVASREESSANGCEVAPVMPAQPVPSSYLGAGIQGPQAQASGESSWIPASAGMTSPSASSQTHNLLSQPKQVPDPSPQTLDTLVSSPSSTTTPTTRRLRWWQVLLLVAVLALGGGLAANWRLVRLVAASYFPPPVPEPLACLFQTNSPSWCCRWSISVATPVRSISAMALPTI